jgi:hypothetical protein
VTTDRTEPLEQALAEADVSRALTPAQLILIALVGIVLLRLLRRWWETARAEQLTR